MAVDDETALKTCCCKLCNDGKDEKQENRDTKASPCPLHTDGCTHLCKAKLLPGSISYDTIHGVTPE